MPALFFHVVAGVLAGAFFRVQTLAILALAVLAEGLTVFVRSGASVGLSWLLVSQCALQFSYLGGIYLRSVLARPDVAAQPVGQPLEK